MSFATVHYASDGTLGQSASHTGGNLIMAWTSNKADLPDLLLLHVPSGVGSLVPRCSSRLGAPGGGLTKGTLGRARRSRLSR
jgi:hypothetical protein